MKILEMEQGTMEWGLARLGRPTASRFNKLLTEKTLKPSASQKDFLVELLAEWLMGQPLDEWESLLSRRGTDLEEDARLFYEFRFNADVSQVGLVLTDCEKVAGSPDGLVDDDGGLELKCPGPKMHVAYMLDPDGFEIKYRHQCQGLLWLTGRNYWDLMSFHPSLPEVVRRLEPNLDYFQKLEDVLWPFVERLDAEKERWEEYKVARIWEDPEWSGKIPA